MFRPVNLSTQIPLLQNQSVDIVCGPATNTVGSTFAVCATYKTTPITGIMERFLPVYMHAETIMRLEQAPATGLATGGDTDPENNNWSSCAAP